MTPYEAYIRQAAAMRGIDPNTAVRVALGEGGLTNPFNRSNAPAPKSQDPSFGAKENSYGPFQLYISGRNAGLGDRALAAGIDPRKDWQGGVNFALDEVKRAGWGQWYGAKAQGITGRMGIGGNPSAVPPAVQQLASQAPTTPPQAVPGAVSPDSVAQAIMPVAAQQQAAQQAMQNAAVAQQQAATQAAAQPAADPFGGLLSLFAMSQAQPAPPKNVEMTVPKPKPTSPIDPQLQVALTSQTPNVYLERMRKMRKSYG